MKLQKSCGYKATPDLDRAECKFGHMMIESATLFRKYKDVNVNWIWSFDQFL